MNTIIGVFDNPADARRAMEALRASTLSFDDVSIISRTGTGDATTRDSEDVSAGEGAAVGAVWGGLVGLTALLIPGVGPFIAGGALFAALTGAVTGAVVGGITAALVDFSGIPEAEARGYEDQVRAGKTLVAVRARDEDAAEARRILTSLGADSIRDNQVSAGAEPFTGRRVHVAMYDEQGKRVDREAEYGATRTEPGAMGQGTYASPSTGTSTTGDRPWTSGEVVGEGQGAGPRKDTGTYQADQWVGEGQGDVTPDDPTKRKP
jgi:uncharacterized membrane protein